VSHKGANKKKGGGSEGKMMRSCSVFFIPRLRFIVFALAYAGVYNCHGGAMVHNEGKKGEGGRGKKKEKT